ncbi:MAG: hypothetical protein HW374_379 [Bacteroidetes bacterium]|nr:hypothetical protein [Bacteroidota bacterium]
MAIVNSVKHIWNSHTKDTAFPFFSIDSNGSFVYSKVNCVDFAMTKEKTYRYLSLSIAT